MTSELVTELLSRLGVRLAKTLPLVSAEEVAEQLVELEAEEQSDMCGPPGAAWDCAGDSNASGGLGNLWRPHCTVETDTAFFFLGPYHPIQLQHVLMYSPGILSESHAKPLFVLYQVHPSHNRAALVERQRLKSAALLLFYPLFSQRNFCIPSPGRASNRGFACARAFTRQIEPQKYSDRRQYTGTCNRRPVECCPNGTRPTVFAEASPGTIIRGCH